MYAEAKKAIYGTLEASVILWIKLSKSLEEMVYKRNEYDWCVIKKLVTDNQCTILWNVDDLKMSYVDPDDFSSVLAKIDAEYGNIAERTISRGKIHKYLGMTIE